MNTFRAASEVLNALQLAPDERADPNLFAALNLAATSSDVAAYIHRAANEPLHILVADFDPPAHVVAIVSQAGIDWSKFVALLPRLRRLQRVLHAFREAPTC